MGQCNMNLVNNHGFNGKLLYLLSYVIYYYDSFLFGTDMTYTLYNCLFMD